MPGTDARFDRRCVPTRRRARAGARADAQRTDAQAQADWNPVVASAPQRSPWTAALRRRSLFALVLVPIIVLLGARFTQASDAEASLPSNLTGIVHSSDGQLSLSGRPFQAVGFNDYRLTASDGGYVCDSGYGALSDGQLGDLLDRARAAGATVIRTWFFQSSWDPNGDGSGDWAPFDRVVSAAAERGLRVVPVLANQWGDCENGAADKDLAFYQSGYREPQQPYALSYLDYATAVAKHYAGSPAIAYWQLVNEPEASSQGNCDETAAADALSGFATAASEAIRSVDPHHLISLGTIGGGQCGTAGADYLKASSAVDVCEIHVYDGSDTGTSPTTPMPEAAAASISACSGAGKPVVAGELGFAADLDSSGQPTGTVSAETLANRAHFLAERVSAMEGAGLDGFMVWQLDSREPLADGADTYAVGPCDPLDGVIASTSGVDTHQLAAAQSCGPPAAQGSAA